LKAYDRGLLEIFSAEQAEHIQRIRAIADSLAAMPVEARAGAFEEILRRAHTLKGASRAVGLEVTEQLAHRLESLFGRAREAHSALGEGSLAGVHRGLDAMEDVLAAVIAGRPEPDSAAAFYLLGEGPIDAPGAEVGRTPWSAAGPPASPSEPWPKAPQPRGFSSTGWQGHPGSAAGSAAHSEAVKDSELAGVPSEVGQTVSSAAPASGRSLDSPLVRDPAAAAPAAIEFVRVNAANIDGLIRSSSQLMASVSAESVAQQHADDSAWRASQALTEFLRLRRACKPYLRAREADPETAPLRECLEFVDRELHALAGEARSSAAAQHHRAWELRQRVTDLHQNAVNVRMIPAESVFGAFGAMTRQIAQDEGKEIEFRVEGLETQADRLVLQALKDPVMHLLRNAVSHGIELPEQRTEAGKSPLGCVRLRIDARGDRLYVAVEDDGRGLNVEAVTERGVALGLITREEAALASPGELTKLIFRPGMSTSEAVTSISGRGMGLSVVQQTVDRLQGEIEIRAGGHGGLLITISVALSISTQHLLLLEAGGFIFGVQTRFIKQLVRIQLSGLQTMGEVLIVEGKPVPLARLTDLLGLPPNPSAEAGDEGRDSWVSIAALALGEQTIGVIADRLLDEREAVVKDLGLPRQMTGVTAGGIPLEDGRVALVLNPPAIFARFRDTGRGSALLKPSEQAEKSTRRILVVDDSLTTRSLEKSILEAHGFQVSVAVDGVEALEKLSAQTFDLVITDVAMPRMDGMQLLEQMKKRNSTARIPVIIVTSLESKEDQQRGMSLGADAYIVKRKFDRQELLRTVRQIL
jgi:two-component system, chemotaxis family, sensor kinase CheA